MSTINMSRQKKVTKVLEYLGRNRLMTLGTSSHNKPWAATVFYAYDKKLNIYFYSRPDTKHCQHIDKNQNVSIVINHDWRHNDGSIRGLQLIGYATKMPKKNYKQAYALYRTRFKWADEFTSDHILYRVKPQEIWYIDEKLFGHFHRVKVS